MDPLLPTASTWFGNRTLSPTNETMARAKMVAQRAIALDEELPEAHVALGIILLTYDWDWMQCPGPLDFQIQVSPEKQIWMHSYERSLHDVLALQNEIAAAIAAEVQGKLTPQQQSRLSRNRTVNPEAQLAYWKARYFLNLRKDRIADRKSLEYSELAVRMDPGYAPAQAALAM
jgi:hypothetical protein